MRHQKTPSKTTSGHAVTNLVIAERLRVQIVSGEFQPGSRLPTRSELEARFGTTATTVQRAFDVLAADGFVEARGSRGTFVAEHPPHLSRHALVFPGEPSPDPWVWSPFWSRLRQQSKIAEHTQGCRISSFFRVDQHGNTPDYHRLIHELETHQLAGIIFVINPYHLRGTAIMRFRDVPMVSIAYTMSLLDMPVAQINHDSFFSRALDYLVSKGCKSVAGLTLTGNMDYIMPGMAEANVRGLHTEECWWLPVNITQPHNARVYTHLLMRPEQQNRPQALLVADDSLIEPALQGLKDAGVRVPQDLEVVAMCSFPQVRPPIVPLRRLGYSVPHIMGVCLDLLAQQRNGNIPPPLTAIEAVWEEEIETVPALAGQGE